MSVIFAVLGVVVVVGLSVYAGTLWRQVYQLREEQKAQEIQEAEKLAERRQYILDSINVIARVLVDGQGNITECAIRLKVLLENLFPEECPKPEFRPLYELAWATSHMPILDQRKTFSKKEIRAFDKEREALEEKMKDDVVEAAKAVLAYDFSD